MAENNDAKKATEKKANKKNTKIDVKDIYVYATTSLCNGDKWYDPKTKIRIKFKSESGLSHPT